MRSEITSKNFNNMKIIITESKIYYKTIYAQGDITKFEYERISSESPTSEILDKDVIVSLNGYFGDLWKPVFKQWFKDKTGMDYKTLYLN